MSAEAPSIFTDEQLTTIGRLRTPLLFLAPLLLAAGGLRVALGVLDVWQGSLGGLISLPSGALLAFAGLAFLAGAADADFLRTVKGREKEHFTNATNSINVGFTSLLIFGCYEAFFGFINLWV